MIVTIEEVKDYIGLDFEDAQVTRNLNRVIAVAEKMLEGSLGKNYPSEDARVKEMALMISDDLYSERGVTSTKVSNNVRRLFDDLTLQVKMEMRGKENGL